eukprot:snap_masked-scaffold1412_size42778-processed-gene-0.3 protein:Tk01222 transcript:snap_masked-scaffold1412_size42778-processed-gene-0.3-mRNA-1 annotation:"hypothetical protein"
MTPMGGGKGAENLRNTSEVGALLKDHDAKGRLIGAVCAAPTVLLQHGIAKGKKITSYPAFKDQLASDYNYLEDTVVVDGHIVTSRGPGTCFQFGHIVPIALLSIGEVGKDQPDWDRNSVLQVLHVRHQEGLSLQIVIQVARHHHFRGIEGINHIAGAFDVAQGERGQDRVSGKGGSQRGSRFRSFGQDEDATILSLLDEGCTVLQTTLGELAFGHSLVFGMGLWVQEDTLHTRDRTRTILDENHQSWEAIGA